MDRTILLSEDNGHTWPYSTAFPDASNITFSCILKNGNILFGVGSKLYLSTDNLKTYRQLSLIHISEPTRRRGSAVAEMWFEKK